MKFKLHKQPDFIRKMIAAFPKKKEERSPLKSSKHLYPIEDYKRSAILIEEATEEELEAIKTFLIKKGFKFSERKKLKPINKEVMKDVCVPLHETWQPRFEVYSYKQQRKEEKDKRRK